MNTQPTAPTFTTRPAINSGFAGYIVSVVYGPQDLLWRSTEAAALADGAAYVERNWEHTADGWRAKAAS